MAEGEGEGRCSPSGRAHGCGDLSRAQRLRFAAARLLCAARGGGRPARALRLAVSVLDPSRLLLARRWQRVDRAEGRRRERELKKGAKIAE